MTAFIVIGVIIAAGLVFAWVKFPESRKYIVGAVTTVIFGAAAALTGLAELIGRLG